jgi:hypothetical protein
MLDFVSKNIKSEDFNILKYSIFTLRHAASNPESSILQRIAWDFSDRLFEIIKTYLDESILYESLWIIHNISSSDDVALADKFSGIENLKIYDKFLLQFKKTKDGILSLIISILGNIAESNVLKTNINKTNIIPTVIKIIDQPMVNIELTKNSLFFISIICNHNYKLDIEEVIHSKIVRINHQIINNLLKLRRCGSNRHLSLGNLSSN